MKKVILSAIIGALFGGAVVFATTQTPVSQQNQIVANAKGLPETVQDTPKVIENKEDYGQSSEFKQNAFGLTPDNSKYLSMNNLYNVSGKCGNANVYLLSAGILEKNIFTSHYEKTELNIICQDNKRLDIFSNVEQTENNNPTLEDFNLFSCIQTSNGYKIILSGNCRGSACGEKFENPHIINTNTCEYEIENAEINNIINKLI